MPITEVANFLGPLLEDEDVLGNDEEDEKTAEVPEHLRVRTVGSPPSRSAMLEHYRLHTPYRSWCPVCVSARGPDVAHKSGVPGMDDREARNEVAFDYCFMRDRQGGASSTVLVGRDRKSGLYSGHVVPYKGAAAEWVVEQTIRDLKKMGYHGLVTLRGDQEHAIQDVLQQVANGRGEARTVIEMAPRSDSQANGFVERAVRSVEESIRLQHLAFEQRTGLNIPASHPLFAWLVEFSVDLLNKVAVGKDGKTAFERLKGKRYRNELLPFGVRAMARVNGKPQGGLMQPRWVESLVLGTRFHTNEYIAARLEDGHVVRTRGVRELPEVPLQSHLDGVVGEPHAPAGVITTPGSPGK